jgi:hypothetical protein
MTYHSECDSGDHVACHAELKELAVLTPSPAPTPPNNDIDNGNGFNFAECCQLPSLCRLHAQPCSLQRAPSACSTGLGTAGDTIDAQA